MEPRLSLATLAARNVRELAAYYERLGWKAGLVTDEVAFFQLNGVVLGLWNATEFARETGRPVPPSGSPGVALSHNARSRDEVDRLVAEAEHAGARVVRAAHDAAWGGRSAFVADPEGHLWEFAWNPSWPIGPDGSVALRT